MDRFFYMYYIETNAVCILLLLLMQQRIQAVGSVNSARQRLFHILIYTTIFMCISDLVAGLSRGQFFPGARSVIQVSNIVYCAMMSSASAVWYQYVCQRTNTVHSGKTKVLFSIPYVAVILALVTNPWTNFMFSVDENNLYVRGPGITFHWIATWFYFFYTVGHTLRLLIKEPSRMRKSEYYPLLRFVIAPFLAGLSQMLLYGVTSAQVGITISIVLLCLDNHESLISVDELTGINNRKQLNHFVESGLLRSAELPVFVVLMDINNFKSINDTYGHLVGDHALIDTAKALKHVCEQVSDRFFLCRFGGDEFVITGRNISENELSDLVLAIRQEMVQLSESSPRPYSLSLSIGTATGICDSMADFDHLLRTADEAMYDEKKRSKQ